MRKRIRKYFRALGPGFITGSSDNDPSGVATYAQAGATLGFDGLWTALLALPLATAVQEASDRVALATGKGLGTAARDRYNVRGRLALAGLIALLMATNALNICADLLAIGAGMNLLGLGPEWLWALLSGAIISALVVAGSYRIITRVFALLSLTLLAYIVVLFAIRPEPRELIAGTFAPNFSLTSQTLSILIAVLGTSISPYLFFWQPEHRVEEMRDEEFGGSRVIPVLRRSNRNAREKMALARFDVFAGIGFSTIVMWAIIAATAATIKGEEIQSAAQAAEALRPVAGQLAETLFALGFIGTGMLAVPVLAGAGASALAGLFNKPSGFSHHWKEARFFYALVLVGSVAGMALSLLQVNPIQLLVITAFVNGIVSVPFLIVVHQVANDRATMKELVSGWLSKTLMLTTIGVMSISAIALVYSLFLSQ